VNKRLMGIIGLLALFAIVAAACNQGNDAASGGTTGTTGATGGTTGTTGAPSFTTIESGVLTVGSCLDYPPFESVKNGDEQGFDVDLTEAIAAKMGLTVKWVRANFDTIFTAVGGHQFDMVAAAVTATGDTGAERAQVVAFSDYYYNSRQSLAVNSDSGITSTDQLGAGNSVGVQKGTTGKIWAEDNLAPNGVEIKTYTSATEAFRDLQAGVVDGVINDEPSSAAIIEQFPGTAVVQPIDTNEKYAFAFAKDTPELLAAWNIAQKAVIDDGTYAQLYAKYFPGAPVPEEFQPAA
jgi:polar amino acid transport system substrate-binding protein